MEMMWYYFLHLQILSRGVHLRECRDCSIPRGKSASKHVKLLDGNRRSMSRIGIGQNRSIRWNNTGLARKIWSLRSFRGCTLIKKIIFFSKKNASSGGYSFWLSDTLRYPLLYVVLIFFFVLARSVRSSAHWAYAIIVFGLLGWTLTLYLYLFCLSWRFFSDSCGKNYALSIVPVGLCFFLFLSFTNTIGFPWFFSPSMPFFFPVYFFLSSSSVCWWVWNHDFRRTISNSWSLYWLYGIHMFGSAIFAIALGAVKVFFFMDSIERAFNTHTMFVPMIILGFFWRISPIFGIVEQFRYMFLSTLPFALYVLCNLVLPVFQLSYIALKNSSIFLFIIAFLVIVLSVHVLIIPIGVSITIRMELPFDPYWACFCTLLERLFQNLQPQNIAFFVKKYRCSIENIFLQEFRCFAKSAWK